MSENILEKSIGSGPTFPIQLTSGSWKPKKGSLELIEDNIISILVYQIGFRLRQEIFGTRNYECLEEPNINATRLLVYRFTKEAIEAWEPRVRLLETKIQFTPSEIQIRLRYQVLTNRMVGELDFSYQKSA